MIIFVILAVAGVRKTIKEMPFDLIEDWVPPPFYYCFFLGAAVQLVMEKNIIGYNKIKVNTIWGYHKVSYTKTL